MNFKAFFTREVDSRLAEGLNGFVWTVRRYLFPQGVRHGFPRPQ